MAAEIWRSGVWTRALWLQTPLLQCRPSRGSVSRTTRAVGVTEGGHSGRVHGRRGWLGTAAMNLPWRHPENTEKHLTYG